MKKLFYLVLGLTVSFASCSDDDDKYYEEGVSLGTTLKLDGGVGGSEAENSVYVDFSTESQKMVTRASWDLGFHCGTQFGVILNNTIGSRAITAAEGIEVATIINEDDREKLKTALVLSMAEGGNSSIIDNLSGDLDKTVINKKGQVYIYDSGIAGDAGAKLYKIEVVEKDANTYTLTYALWNSSDVQTLDVKKNTNKDFVGASFATKNTVEIKPDKANWDLVWGRMLSTAPAMGANNPILISDVVYTNHKNGVKVAEIVIAEGATDNDEAYQTYDESDIASTTFSSGFDVIGINWRISKVDMTATPPVAKVTATTDRFYVIKDTEGNVYKLRFISASNADGGERGKPEIEYVLVKEAN